MSDDHDDPTNRPDLAVPGGRDRRGLEGSGGGAVNALVLALALAKGTAVIRDYMGLRGVRPPVPWVVLGWLVLVLAVIGVCFLPAAGR